MLSKETKNLKVVLIPMLVQLREPHESKTDILRLRVCFEVDDDQKFESKWVTVQPGKAHQEFVSEFFLVESPFLFHKTLEKFTIKDKKVKITI
jgi:hypothetical protein